MDMQIFKNLKWHFRVVKILGARRLQSSKSMLQRDPRCGTECSALNLTDAERLTSQEFTRESRHEAKKKKKNPTIIFIKKVDVH